VFECCPGFLREHLRIRRHSETGLDLVWADSVDTTEQHQTQTNPALLGNALHKYNFRRDWFNKLTEKRRRR
jgi:hypothetical protein